MIGYELAKKLKNYIPKEVKMNFGIIYSILLKLERENRIKSKKVCLQNRDMVYYFLSSLDRSEAKKVE